MYKSVTEMKIYKKNPLTAGRVIDKVAFVVTPEDNKLHNLNESATELWQLAATGCSLSVATEYLLDNFDVEAEQAKKDALECFEDLVQRHILIETQADLS